MVSFRSCLAALTALILASGSRCPASTNLTDWLAAQRNIRAWSADFTQTRQLKALVQPLKSQGHLWFAPPNLFRWELGAPAQTIAVRQTNELLLIYPKLKRVERYPLGAMATGQWGDTLALLEAGFPREQRDIDERFSILAVTAAAGNCSVRMQPKSRRARRWVQEIEVVFNTENYSLAASELKFADGSALRNDFTNARLNERIEASLFAPQIGTDFQVVEPLKQQLPK